MLKDNLVPCPCKAYRAAQIKLAVEVKFLDLLSYVMLFISDGSLYSEASFLKLPCHLVVQKLFSCHFIWFYHSAGYHIAHFRTIYKLVKIFSGIKDYVKMMVLNFHPRESYLWKTAHTLLTLKDINSSLSH